MRMIRSFIVFLLVFTQIGLFIPIVYAKTTQQKENKLFTVLININSSGYFRPDGTKIERIEIPANRNIKITVKFTGNLDGGEEEVHDVAIMRDEEMYFEHPIGPKIPGEYTVLQSSLIFFSGNGTEKNRFDMFCVRPDCKGMEHLLNVIIDVV